MPENGLHRAFYCTFRIVLTVFALPLCIFFFAGCAGMMHMPVTHTELKPDELGKLYSPRELKSDLKTLMETLEAVHPDLYAYTSMSVIDSSRRMIEQELTVPMTRIEFYSRIAPLVSQIGDGHTNVGPPMEEYARFRLQERGPAFPLNVACDSLPGIAIMQNYSGDSTLGAGDRIVSIDGLSADSLAAVFLRGFSGERMAFRRQRVAGSFRMLLWFSDIHPPYDLVVRRHGSLETAAGRVAGVTRDDILRSDSLLTKRSAMLPAYRFERLEDGIGCIDFRAMSDLNGFRKFLSATFADIRSNPVRGLIVDLRNNGGGNSQLGSELLSFLTDSSYRMAQRKEWKMSAQYKSYMRSMVPWWIRWFPFTWVSSEARKYLGARDGEIVVDSVAPVPPDTNSLRYRGKTCFLIGPGTFSSAMMLANAVGDYKLATLIGEETGGIPTAYGEVYSFDLPVTRLSVGVSSAFFVRANGNMEDRRGVMPDIETRQSDEDTRTGKDTVLERAKKLILEGK